MALYLIALSLCCVIGLPRFVQTQYKGSFMVDIPFYKLETLLTKMENMTNEIRTMKADQDILKEHILKRLDGLEEKTELCLTNGQQGNDPLIDKVTRIEHVLNKTSQNVQDLVDNLLKLTDLPKPTDCQDVYNKGFTSSGIYLISPDSTKMLTVYCEQELDGGGWTVFQARQDGHLDFYRDWAAYKAGFGNLSGEFWLGNDNIHLLTKGHDRKLKIELKYQAETEYADYSEFWIDNESLMYRLHVSGFSDAKLPGDSFMRRHNGKNFSTKDRDNDNWSNACAVDRHGAWWYDKCFDSNLNGPWGVSANAKGLIWKDWKGWATSLTGTRMMVKKWT